MPRVDAKEKNAKFRVEISSKMQRIWKRTFAEASGQKLLVNLTVPHAVRYLF